MDKQEVEGLKRSLQVVRDNLVEAREYLEKDKVVRAYKSLQQADRNLCAMMGDIRLWT